MMYLSPIVGQITPPDALVAGYGAQVDTPGKGLILLFSNLIKFFFVIAGLWVFVNVILAGFTFVTNGSKPEKIGEATDKIYMSIIGLVIMLASFVLTAVISFLLYKDPMYILSPKLYGPTTGATPGSVNQVNIYDKGNNQ
ncbi:hypothetical protein GYA19_04575 [Candidatus Beckwithbacteria bacterium]|nr:hypothetical protein [Candidatus Beckwithbacteria bacterium]